jgi:hypothetical protein
MRFRDFEDLTPGREGATYTPVAIEHPWLFLILISAGG